MNKQLEKAFKEPTRLDMIIAFMNDTTDSVRLHPELERVLERYHHMDALIYRFNRMKECVSKHMKRYPAISKSTAMRDFYDTKQVFYSSHKSSNDYDRVLIMEKAWHLLRMAMADKDVHAGAKVIEVLRKMNKDQKEEDILPPILPPAIFIVANDPEIMGRKKLSFDELQKLKKKWNRAKRTRDVDAIDVEHEDLTDAE
jgi:hypothetical protein